MQALLGSQAVASQLGLCIDCDGARAVGFAVVQIQVLLFVLGRLVLLKSISQTKFQDNDTRKLDRGINEDNVVSLFVKWSRLNEQ